jgi:hypothetical protein
MLDMASKLKGLSPEHLEENPKAFQLLDTTLRKITNRLTQEENRQRMQSDYEQLWVWLQRHPVEKSATKSELALRKSSAHVLMIALAISATMLRRLLYRGKRLTASAKALSKSSFLQPTQKSIFCSVIGYAFQFKSQTQFLVLGQTHLRFDNQSSKRIRQSNASNCGWENCFLEIPLKIGREIMD